MWLIAFSRYIMKCHTAVMPLSEIAMRIRMESGTRMFPLLSKSCMRGTSLVCWVLESPFEDGGVQVAQPGWFDGVVDLLWELVGWEVE